MRSLTRPCVPIIALALFSWACSADQPLPMAAGPLQSHANAGLCADDPAPVISTITATPNRLWPPNHKMVTVRLTYTVSDANLTGVSLRITSNEPVNGLGDGNTAPDWSVGSVTSTGATVQLRAERSGLGRGRTYTLTVIATDACGHTTMRSVEVRVPHDRRGK